MTRYLSFFSVMCLFYSFCLNAWTSEETLKEANWAYQQGEEANTFGERQQSFNQALYLYSLLEQHIQPPHALHAALANTYFQLEEYAYSVLYNQRALKVQPESTDVRDNLEKSLQKLGLPLLDPPSFFPSLFAFLSQRVQVVFWILIVTFLLYSARIWFSFRSLSFLCTSLSALLFLLLGTWLLSFYLMPLEGIVLKSTGLYAHPNSLQPQLATPPLLAGSKVRVLATTPEGDWFQVIHSTGTMGYLPQTHLGLI